MYRISTHERAGDGGSAAAVVPEEEEGGDTRTDVYALGVVLYQVLSGRLPHDVSSRSLPEAARIIREEPPARLSRTSRVLRGELETIVAKAIEKDKARRYQSAADLGTDLRRYLAGEPILASPDTLYVLGKQLTRYRWVVGGVLIGVSHDGKTLVAGAENGMLSRWRLDSRVLVDSRESGGSRITSVVFLRDNSRFFTTHEDRTIRVWIASSAEVATVLHGHAGHVVEATLLPDDALATIDGGGTIRLWLKEPAPLP